ncbi:MAG TPA: hypothetical protein VIT68_00935 [Candidatus Gracilibacteria bacterium]
MKARYTLLAILISLSFISVTQAADNCSTDVTAAVNSRGICHVFNTGCDVPDTWKALPTSSCQDVKDDRYKPSMEERLRTRRGYGGGNKLLSDQAARNKKSYSRRNPANTAAIKRRVSSSSIYQDTSDAEDKTGFEDRRARTTRNYASPFANYGNRQAQDKNELTDTAKAHQRGRIQAYRRLGKALRKEANRTGAFSNDPNWEVQAENHTTGGSTGESKYWDNPRLGNTTPRTEALVDINPDGSLNEADLRRLLLKRNRKRRLYQFKDADIDAELNTIDQ